MHNDTAKEQLKEGVMSLTAPIPPTEVASSDLAKPLALLVVATIATIVTVIVFRGKLKNLLLGRGGEKPSDCSDIIKPSQYSENCEYGMIYVITLSIAVLVHLFTPGLR